MTETPNERFVRLHREPTLFTRREYFAIADALNAAEIEWEPWQDMLGPSLMVGGQTLVWAPEFNVNGENPRVWVVTFAHDDDDTTEADTPEQVPADLSHLFQISVADGPRAIKTIIAIVRKELDTHDPT